MLQSKAKIIPVFYKVKPWELRHIERGAYAKAFIMYEEKNRYMDKVSEWKAALNNISLIAGEEVESEWDCQELVSAVQKEVERTTLLHVAAHPVGLDDRVKDFERIDLVKDFERRSFQNQCGLAEGKYKGNIIGIFGMGGVGKTTLVKELFNRKKTNYSKASFLFDVREAFLRSELPSLQSQLLKDLFEEDRSLTSVEEGKCCIENCLRRSPASNFLIVVDDIDDLEQLNALIVMDVLNESSYVIVTTRDVGVLISAGITVRYNVEGMDRDDGRKLFCWHAFGRPDPDSEYDELVDKFVELCGGLPLSLEVLGSLVHDRDVERWRSELKKVGKTLPPDIKKRLKISFDALDDEQKQIFMDIACFFVGRPKSIAERVWEGSGWDAQLALETLKEKCLLESKEIVKYEGPVLRMHDHLRDLGREMAADFSPHRLWRPQDLKSLDSKDFESILANTNFRCFHSIFLKSLGSEVTFFLSPPNNCVEQSASLLWLQLIRNSTEKPSITPWIPLKNLQYLKIKHGQFRKLWENGKQAPSQLKELQISETSLEEFPDLVGISKDNLENEKESSIVKTQMNCLEKLEIKIRGEKCVSGMILSSRDYPKLKSLKLHGLENLMEVNLIGVETLCFLHIKNCKKLKTLTGTSELINLKRLTISECSPELEELPIPATLVSLSIKSCIGLQRVSATVEFMELAELILSECPKLQKLPSLAKSTSMKKIVIESCERLQNISGIEELHACKYMQLRYCSNAVIQNCIHKLKSVPRRMDMIGRAVPGAESILNEYLFSDVRIGADAVTDIVQFGAENSDDEDSDDEREKREVLSAVMVCFVVAVDRSSSSLEDINQSLESYSIKVREGGWIITMIACDRSLSSYCKKISDVLTRYGVMKKGFRVELKKDEESKSLKVLQKIVDKLH